MQDQKDFIIQDSGATSYTHQKVLYSAYIEQALYIAPYGNYNRLFLIFEGFQTCAFRGKNALGI